MADSRTNKIAGLNDLCRKALRSGSRLILTAGICMLPPASRAAILDAVEGFTDFNPDNNPHGERDFGNFQHGTYKVFWKIDYYDKACVHGSEDPADPAVTTRVLTIMLASEY